MDRSYLSQREVIEASRKFICVRLMTYESASEIPVLQQYWRPGADLENTLFVILDPYGRPLTMGSRSPGWIFQNAQAMASGLNDVARQYPGRGENQGLPVVSSVRLGMNVAACDKLPLAIVVSDDAEERRILAAQLAPLAWSKDLIGEMTYAAGTRNDLQGISGSSVSRGYVFVSPNEFGNQGRVVAQLGAGANAVQLEQAMKMTIKQHRPEIMDHREHIRLGRMEGVSWMSATPVTDPHSPEHGQGGGGAGSDMRGSPHGGPATNYGGRPQAGRGGGPGYGQPGTASGPRGYGQYIRQY